VEIEKHITQVPTRSQECWDDLALVGVLVDIADDGKATAIETVRVAVESKEEQACMK